MKLWKKYGDGMKMMKNEKECWRKVLKLWKGISSLPDEENFWSDTYDWKNEIAISLLGEEFWNGCPFCEKYLNNFFCPLGICYTIKNVGSCTACYGYSYSEWEDFMEREEKHSQEIARRFYNELLIRFVQRCGEYYERGFRPIFESFQDESEQHYVLSYDTLDPTRYAFYHVLVGGGRNFMMGGKTLNGLLAHLYDHFVNRYL